MKYMIWYFKKGEDVTQFFKTKEEMDAKIKELLIEAKKESSDDRGYPDWCFEFVASKIIGEFIIDSLTESIDYKESI